MEEADPDTLYLEPRKVAGYRLDRGLVQRPQYPAVHVDPLRHHEPALARHERQRLLDHDVVLVVTALVADIEHVAEAFGGDEGGKGALALDDRVGRECGAVDEQANRRRIDAGARDHVVHAGEHSIVRSVRRREDLGGGETISVLQHDVGECTAHVDANPETGL